MRDTVTALVGALLLGGFVYWNYAEQRQEAERIDAVEARADDALDLATTLRKEAEAWERPVRLRPSPFAGSASVAGRRSR